MKKYISLIVVLATILQSITVFSAARVQQKPGYVVSEERFWAMTVDKNRDYVFFADGTKGIKIADISKPLEMKQVGKIETGVLVRSVERYKNYVYTIPVDKSQVYIYDVTDVTMPYQAGTITVSQAARIFVGGDMLYVLAGKGTIEQFSLEDPIEPKKKGTISGIGEVIGFYPEEDFLYITNKSGVFSVIDTDTLNTVATINISGATNVTGLFRYKDFLYGLQSLSGVDRIYVINVKDPTTPKLDFELKDGVYGPMRGYVDGNVFYVMGIRNGNDPRIQRYLIGNDGNLTKEWDIACEKSPCGIYAKGDYLFAATIGSLAVYDTTFKLTKDMIPPVPETYSVTEVKDSAFTDIKGNRYEDEIKYLYNKGIINGVDNNKYYPDENATRVQLFAAVTNMLKYNLSRYKHSFSDVSNNAWYCDMVQTIWDNGLISDEFIDDGNIFPEKELDVNVMADVLVNAYYSEKPNLKKEGTNIECARKLGIIKEESSEIIISRAMMANAVFITSKLIRNEAVYIDDGKYFIGDNKKVSFTQLIDSSPKQIGTDGEWKIPPAVFRVNDAVKPGELINVYGEGFTENSEVYVQLITDSQLSSEPSKESLKLKIHDIDIEGQYITAQLSKDAKPGSYQLWVSNSYGYSLPICLNSVRVQWIDRLETAYGQPFKIMGTNLCASEFGAEMASGVALVDAEGKAYDIDIVDINPFCIEAVVPSYVPIGRYTVATSNDGYIWDISDDVSYIDVVGSVEDPLQLGMAWANRFVWDNIIDVTKAPYNVVPDGQADCTEAIQKAIDDAKEAGGGRIYLPEGIYKMKSVWLPSKVTIEGAGSDKTTLIYCNHDASDLSPMISAKDDGKTEGIVGVANLTLKTVDKESCPDVFLWFAEDWGRNIEDRNQRTADYVFIKGCKIETTWDSDDYFIGGRRGLGIVIVADEHVLIDDNVMYGKHCCIQANYIGSYAYYTRNKTINSSGYMFAVTSRTVFTDNLIDFQLELVPSSYSQGIFCRGYSYVSHNDIRNCGETTANAGEIVCTEPYRGGMRFWGKVTGAKDTILTVEPYLDENGVIYHDRECYYNEQNCWNVDIPCYGETTVAIVKGRGLGQLRTVISGDRENNTLTIDEPWDILPDETSVFDVITASKGCLWYNNYATNCRKGFWFYGDTYDCVMASNTGVNIEGCYARSYHRLTPNRVRTTIAYFTRFDGNKMNGFAKLVNKVAIGIQASGENEGYLSAYTAYAGDLKNNVIVGGDIIPEMNDTTESPAMNGIYIIGRKSSSDQRLFKAGLIENNVVSKLDTGLSVGADTADRSAAFGIVIRNNDFSDNKTPIKDPGNVIISVDD